MREHGKPDVVITDPPRAGYACRCGGAYSGNGKREGGLCSCNAATQARDLEMLQSKYDVATH